MSLRAFVLWVVGVARCTNALAADAGENCGAAMAQLAIATQQLLEFISHFSLTRLFLCLSKKCIFFFSPHSVFLIFSLMEKKRKFCIFRLVLRSGETINGAAFEFTSCCTFCFCFFCGEATTRERKAINLTSRYNSEGVCHFASRHGKSKFVCVQSKQANWFSAAAASLWPKVNTPRDANRINLRPRIIEIASLLSA